MREKRRSKKKGRKEARKKGEKESMDGTKKKKEGKHLVCE